MSGRTVFQCAARGCDGCTVCEPEGKDMIRVAVYGSLKRGFGNHYLLANRGLFLGAWLSGPDYSMYNLGAFPAVIKGDTSIVCEVYQVDEPTLEHLDRLEGHPEFYKRELVPTELWGDVWLYVFTEQEDIIKRAVISNGFWIG